MTHRYFRATAPVYSAAKQALDAIWGFPSAQSGTLRSIPEPESAPSDPAGNLYLAVAATHCAEPHTAALLDDVLSSGGAEEISQAAYREATTRPWPFA